MNAVWLTGKQAGDRLFKLFNDLGIGLPSETCPLSTPGLRRQLGVLLMLLAAGDREAFNVAFKTASSKTRSAFAYLLADIIGSLRKLPDDTVLSFPNTFSGWLLLLQTLQLANLPIWQEILSRLEAVSETGLIPPDDLLHLGSLQEIRRLKNMQPRRASFSLSSALLCREAEWDKAIAELDRMYPRPDIRKSTALQTEER